MLGFTPGVNSSIRISLRLLIHPHSAFRRRHVRGPLLPLLPAVGGHQLDVHVRPERAGRDGRHGPLRHQRLVRLPPVLGRPARPVRRTQSEQFITYNQSIDQ